MSRSPAQVHGARARDNGQLHLGTTHLRGLSWPMRSPSISAVEDSYSAHFHLSRLGRQPDGVPPIEGLRMSQAFEHKPVMAAEVVALLQPVPPGLVVDATVGGGGHAALVLSTHPHLSVLGLDRDEEAVAAARARLAPWGGRAQVVRARFDQMGAVVATAARGPVVAVLFDLGVSSPQLDRTERGFSYRQDGPLDMRMDQSQGLTASEVVNTASEAHLVEMLVANGEGRWAKAMARAMVAARPLQTTGELARVVSEVVPAPARRRGNPASRVFQALRIEVNQELAVLAPALGAAIDLLVPRGRGLVLSYHSGEDRLVKSILARAATGGCVCPPSLPCVCGARPLVRLLTRGARLPSAAEVEGNRRASSARLRAVERLDVAP